jgi:hypothetical protein
MPNIELLHNALLAGGIDSRATIDDEGVQANGEGNDKALAVALVLRIRGVICVIPIHEDIPV